MKRGSRLVVALVAVLVCALLMSCAADQAFVLHMRETHDAVAPEYSRYVEADPTLSAEQKTRRARTAQIWNESIAAQEKGR